MNNSEINNITNLLQNESVVIIPTDTIYGICCRVSAVDQVERIYNIKGRDTAKPFVVLIADFTDLTTLGCHIDDQQKAYLESIWPGPISIIIPTKSQKHITRSKGSIAVRMPAEPWLKKIIATTGPIVATSANISDSTYEHDLAVITDTFTKSVDYISKTETPAKKPSTIIDITTQNKLR